MLSKSTAANRPCRLTDCLHRKRPHIERRIDQAPWAKRAHQRVFSTTFDERSLPREDARLRPPEQLVAAKTDETDSRRQSIARLVIGRRQE